MKNLKILATNLILLSITTLSCSNPKKDLANNPTQNNDIVCSDNNCQGTYQGKEFINGNDVAHQFSNTMSAKVGDHLKALYKAGKYSKVDFSKIEMITEGMGSGTVTYYLKIPFVRVAKKM